MADRLYRSITSSFLFSSNEAEGKRGLKLRWRLLAALDKTSSRGSGRYRSLRGRAALPGPQIGLLGAFVVFRRDFDPFWFRGEHRFRGREGGGKAGERASEHLEWWNGASSVDRRRAQRSIVDVVTRRSGGKIKTHKKTTKKRRCREEDGRCEKKFFFVSTLRGSFAPSSR